jgi:hypothetical protein
MAKNTNLTELEILQIAEDIYKGQIFTDRHLRDKSMLQSVFMVLALADQKTIDSIKASKPGMFYEYLNKASPTAINGMPIFYSMRMANEDDTKKIFELVQKMEEAMKIVKECAGPSKEKK